MNGEIDYLLHAVYDSVYKRRIERIELSDLTSMFAMETIKSTTVLSVSYAK